MLAIVASGDQSHAKAPATATDASDHWAYRAPERPTLPSVEDSSWPRNGIDYFVLARLEAAGREPSPETEPARLLRRLHLDLTGLPPSLEELKSFLADRRPDAYERRAAALLASPHYGERWATPWLDAARYADSGGYQSDSAISIWPYRDWLIAALNDDIPFTQFTIEQLAGDLLPEPTTKQLVATGFHRSAPLNLEAGIDQEEVRFLQVIDRTNVTASVWLGTTLECAQCHDHKHDPFTQREYYEFSAFFNNTEIESTLFNDKATASFRPAGPRVELKLTDEEQKRSRLSQQHSMRLERAQMRNARRLMDADWRTRLRKVVEKSQTPMAQANLLRIIGEQEPIESDLKVVERYLRLDDETEKRLTLELARRYLPPKVSVIMRELPEPRLSSVLDRGRFLAPLEPVSPGVPAVLPPMADDAPRNRLGLAQWLVDPANPLVARVFVNRTWSTFFGRGIVNTLGDFGTTGEPPTHPLQLDWLASEFWALGTSMKELHRLIVTSATYRQSARLTPEALAEDPDNSLYGRGPRTRLAAELIRDYALFVSGLLDTRLFGPYVHPPQPKGLWRNRDIDPYYPESFGYERYRRGVYTRWRRSTIYPSFRTFNAPDRSVSCLRRTESTTPLQALTLMNDPVYVEAAAALAGRILRESPADDFASRLNHAFLLTLSRKPTARELTLLRSYLEAEFAAFENAPDRARRLIQPWKIWDDERDTAERASWLMLANVLLNLDEMLYRG